MSHQRSYLRIGVLGVLLGWFGAIDAEPLSRRGCEDFSADRVPRKLSETCLYADISQFRISAELVQFTPNYPLWTDGAEKSRWIYLPPGSQIDSSDPDHWVFPKGTLFFKEFGKTVAKDLYSTKTIKVETRLLAKINEGSGVDAWIRVAYAWNHEQWDAVISSGYENVLGTNHDIPTEEQCIQCHQGNADMILGFDALQLSGEAIPYNVNALPPKGQRRWTLEKLQAAGRLTHPFATQPVIPGPSAAKNALGYLHANCGHCHNPLGEAFKQDVKHLVLRHDLAAATLEDTAVYQTAVNQRTRNFTRAPYIVKGAQDDELAINQSAMFIRMNSLLPKNRMPLLGTKEIDYAGIDHIHRWIQSLPTPDELDLPADPPRRVVAAPRKGVFSSIGRRLRSWFNPPQSSGHGLTGTFSFSQARAIPKTALLYMPEDDGLESQPIVDHFDGDFTKNLIVGSPGEDIVLRNSDLVGHTIYAESNVEKHWNIDFMPPNSSTVRKIDWQKDEFVTLQCRLHEYMKAWVGAIETRYYKVIDFRENELEFDFEYQAFPAQFSEFKIWLPEYDPVTFALKKGQKITVDLIRKGQVRGTLTMRRI